MKKLISLILILTFVLPSLAACSESKTNTDTLTDTQTNTPADVMAQEETEAPKP